ncbi:MAG: leukotoxin LktA family filamentous adhesin [Thauera sp.]
MRHHRELEPVAAAPRLKEIVFHVTCALIVSHGLVPELAWAVDIVPDGRTATSVTPTAPNVADVRNNGPVLGNGNAVNSFSRFNVGNGQTANLHVPDGAAALINLVRDQKTTIDGMLNAIKEGRIGGKVYFANPHGVIVGPTGKVNVGSLHVSTPSQRFVDDFFSAPGGAEASSAALVEGRAPRNSAAEIRIDGEVNATDQIGLSAGTITVAGKVLSGAKFVGTDPNFSDVVNVHGLEAGGAVVANQGRIEIVGDRDIEVTGTVSSRRVNTGDDASLRSGDSIAASGDIALSAPTIRVGSGGKLLAAGSGAHAGGDVTLQAQASGGTLDALSDTTARIEATGATLTGRNLRLEASAEHRSTLAPIVTKTTSAAVEVDGSTLEASGSATLEATATTAVTTPDVVPLAVVDVDVTATVLARGNTRITSAGPARLAATTTTTIDARPGLPDFGDLPADAGVAIVTADTTASVDLLGNAELVSTADKAELAATNRTTVDAAVDASAAGSSAVGGSVAVSVVRSTTRARTADNALVNGKTGVSVHAQSDTRVTTSAKAAAGGATQQPAGTSKTEETLADYEDEASTSDGSVSVAAAVAVSDLESTTLAALDATRAATSEGALAVGSEALTQADVVADGSSTGGAVGVGAAVALNLARTSAEARIGGSADAQGIEVVATLPAGDEINRFTTAATSGAGASDVGVAGALALNVIDAGSRARITGSADAKGGEVRIGSDHRSESSASATPAEDATASGDTLGIGASVAVNVVANESRAELANGARLTNAGALTIEAVGDYLVHTEAEAGAEGGIAATPVAAVAVVDNQTHATIGTGERVQAGGKVSVTATHSSTVETSAKGSAEGEKAAVGIAVAVNVVTERVSASVQRDVFTSGAIGVAAHNAHRSTATASASAKGGKGEEEDGSSAEDGVDLEVQRQAGFAQDKQKDGSASKTQQPGSAESSEGKLSVAAAVAVNALDSRSEAYVASGVELQAGGRLAVEAWSNTDAEAEAEGSTAGSTATVGIGAAAAVNSIETHTLAWIGNAKVTANGIAVNAGTETLGDDEANRFSASAKAGAGAGKVGIAGALALNLLATHTRAEVLEGARVDAEGGDVELEADSTTETSATALPDEPVDGGDFGVGASVALNLFREDEVQARIRRGVEITDLDKLRVIANASSDTSATAEAGAAGSVALDAAVALSDLKLNTAAVVEAGAGIVATGAVEIRATSSGEHEAEATGDTESEKVGIGASGAILLSHTTTTASLQRSLKTTTSGEDGNATIDADATRSYEAVAKASAAGGKAEEDTTAAERDKASTSSTLKDNQDAQEGTQTTGNGNKLAVAAAVGAVVMNDDVRASVGRAEGAVSDPAVRLELGGELAISAHNQSDFSARGLGNTLDVTKLERSAKVGIGVGVGLAIARNDTAATIGDGTQVADAAGVQLAAESWQNTSSEFANKLAAEGVAGAGAEKVGIAGALAVAWSQSTTSAWLGDGARIGDRIAGTYAGTVSITADNTSKLAAKAWSAALAGKVGIGASIAILRANNSQRAWIGEQAEVTAAGLQLAGRNHLLNSSPSFDWTILDDLENRFTEANLQVLLGESNYYTETIAGAGSEQVAVTGSFSVNVFDERTEATIGDNANIKSTGTVSVQADNQSSATAFAGGVSAAGKVGVGLASADIVNSSQTRATIGEDARVEQSAAIDVDAAAKMDLAAVTASAAAAGKAGVGGVLSLIDSGNLVEAATGTNSLLRSDGAIDVDASNTFEALGVAGVAGVGGTAGVGIAAGTFLVDNQTKASIGASADVAAAGTIGVRGTSEQDITSVVVGGAGGGKAGVAASAAVNDYNPVTYAWIGDNARINDGVSGSALTGRSLTVHADASTELLSIVGTVGIGGTAGVGGAADVVVMDKETAAWISEGVIARTGDSLAVSATSAEAIRSVGVGLSAGGTAGVQGSASVLVLDIDTLASVKTGSTLFSDGNLVVAADADSDLDLLAGAIGAAGTAAVGAGAAVAVVDKTTHAWIDDGAAITALGNATAAEVADGGFDIDYVATAAGEGEVAAPGITPSDGKNDLAGGSAALDATRTSSASASAHRGLAVTAVNRDDIKGFAVTGAAAGTAAVTLSGEVSVHQTDTRASIGSIELAEGASHTGVQVNADNTGANAAQSVRVAAGNDSFHLGIAGALSASGTVGVGVGADVAAMQHATHAAIVDKSAVNAQRDVEVAATSSQEVVSISASLGASGTVGVAGSVSVLSFDNETSASIGDEAEVAAGGNVSVKADDHTATTLVAGTIALGIGGGGVGAGVGVTLIDKDTRAWIGEGAVVDALGKDTTDLVVRSGESLDETTTARGVQVQAASSEDLFTVSAAAAGGLYLGFAGAVSVATVDSDTAAWIGADARVNQGGGAADAAQDVNVGARNEMELFNVSGALGVGAAGIAGGVDVGVIRNDTTAWIGDRAEVNATRDIGVNALAKTDIESYVVSAAGGIGALAGGVGVYSVGGGLGDEAQGRLESGDDDAGSYADGQATDGSIGSLLGGYEDSRIGDAADRVADERGALAASGRFAATENRTLPAGTAAFVGEDADLEAGRDIDLDARTDVEFDALNGALAIGAIGLGAGVGVADFDNDTLAFVGRGSTLRAGAAGSVTLTAALDEDVDMTAFAGTGGIVAVDAAVALISSTSDVHAGLGDEVAIERANAVNIQADDTRRLEAETTGVSVGLVAAGASVTGSTIEGGATASIGNEVAIGQVAGDTVGELHVLADASHTAIATALAAKGGLGLAASGTVADALVDTRVSATIGDDARIEVARTVEVDANSTGTARASATGINVSLGGAVGASIATATMSPTVSATIGQRSLIEAASFTLAAHHTLPVSGRTAFASASGAAGGLLLGANASRSTALNDAAVNAGVGDDSTLKISGIATVQTDNTHSQLAYVSGVSVGFVAVGANTASASSNTDSHAALGDHVKVEGGALNVIANGEATNHAYGVAGAGGLVSVPFSASYTTTISRTSATTGSKATTQPGDPATIAVDSLTVAATQTSRFDSWMTNMNASLVGASGARTENFARATTTAKIGPDGEIEAGTVAIDASTTLNKGAPAGLLAGTGLARPNWNVESSSGGLADFPAAGSSTILLASTLAEIGARATVLATRTDAATPGIRVDAYNEISASDRVKMASGGAVSAASGESSVSTVCPPGHAACNTGERPTAIVRVGNSARVETTGESDIAMGSRTSASLYAQSAVDVYGLVGVAPEGRSTAIYDGDNRIEIGDADLRSERHIRLAAGAESNGAANVLNATARTDVFNNTAIPVNRDPVADAFVTSRSAVTIAAGADVAAVRNVSLHAVEGAASASGVGIGKDIYRETLAAIASWFSNLFGGGDVSFETRTGRSGVSQDSAVGVDGTVRAGIERKQKLHIDYDGSVREKTDGIDVASSEMRDIYEDILARIEALKALIRDYAVSPGDTSSDAAIATAAYQAEISFLERKLYEMGFGGDPNEPGFHDSNPRQMAEDRVDALDGQLSTLRTARTALETEKTTLEGQVTTLNAPLITDNDTRTAQNVTLNAEIAGINTQIDALDVDDDDYATDLAALQGQIATRQTSIDANNSAITANNQQIALNNAPLDAKIVQIAAVNTEIGGLETTVAKIRQGIDDGDYGDASGAGLRAKFLRITDSVARLGDIDVRADRLTGTGTLDAPGDAGIHIINEGPSFLTLGKLEIASDAGGRLYFNGVEVNNNAGIAAINRGAAVGTAAFAHIVTAEAGSDAPAIRVENRFNPLDDADAASAIGAGVAPVAPDIVLTDAISNLRGLVSIQSEAGGIRLEETASIAANSVEVQALNGDFVQSYTDSFTHVATSPLKEVTRNDGSRDIEVDTSGSGSIVANGSVLIAARYLNINGTIQSGIPEWGVYVPADVRVKLPDGSSVDLAAAKAWYEALDPAARAQPDAEFFKLSNASVSGLTPAQQGQWTQVTVNYNAREDRLELAGVQVQGGYIELFGQIFNTKTGAGKLRVLDGYGQIEVRNDSGKTLKVNTLDAGRGAEGRIVITDLSVDANGNTVVRTLQTFTRSAGDARSGVDAYSPTTNLRYVMATGFNSVRKDEYLYSQNGWFGITAAPVQDQYKVGTTANTLDPLLQGEFLRVQDLADPDAFARNETEVRGFQSVTQGASWKKCNWWTLCANATYYMQYFVTTGDKTTVTGSVRADHPINIEYIGFDTARIAIDSVGDVVLAGSLNNRSGTTSVDTDGRLSQGNTTAVVSGRTIDLSAGTGIGSTTPAGEPQQAVRIRQFEGGVVNADTASGSIHLDQVVGNLNVGRIGSAGVDKVILESAGDILAKDANARVQARRIDLAADNGSIGTLDADGNGAPLRIRSGDSDSLDPDVLARHGLTARARGNINLSNEADLAAAATYTGDLLLIDVASSAGDVRIRTSGSAIDNNPYATVDTRTEDDLAALWDELRLRVKADPDPNDGIAVGADAKAQEAVAAFANGRSNNYRLYWQIRGRQADKGAVYDPGYQYTLTATERRVLADSGMNEAEITAFAANRSAQYHALHAEVGGYTSAFDENFRYAATDAERAAITRGSSWTEAQLLLSVGAGLIKEVTDTVTTIQEPNVVGRKVTLIADGDIGAYGPDLVIDTTAGIDTLTKAERAALAAAERGDADVDDPDNPRIVTLRQPQTVNVTVAAEGALSAQAGGHVLIGSEQDLRIDRIVSGGETRIKVAGGLSGLATATDAVNVQSGGRLILEAASAGIGGTLDPDGLFLTPFGIQLTTPDAGLILRAGGHVWVAAESGLFVDTVFALGDARLDASGSILDFQLTEPPLAPELNLLARNVALSSRNGMIGSSSNPLDVAVSREEGRISGSTARFGEGVYLNGPMGEFFNIANVTSGDAVALSSATFMFIDGRVTGPGPISLVAGASMVLTPFADIHATTLGVFLQASDLLMQESDDGEDAARIQVDVGTIDLRTMGYQSAPDAPRTGGDAIITGIFTGNPTESAILIDAFGSVFDGGDKRLDIIARTGPAATLTIRAGGQIGGNPLDIDVLYFNASSGGLIHLDSPGSLIMGDVLAQREIDIRAAGSITAQSVTSVTEDVKLAANGGNVEVGSVKGRDVTIAARDRLEVDRLEVARKLQLGADMLVAQVFASGGAPIVGSIGGYGGGMSSVADLTLSGLGGFHFDRIAARTGRLDLPVGTLQVDRFEVGERMVVTNPQTRLLIDQQNFRLQGYDVQLHSGGAPFALALDRNLVATDSFVIDRRASHEVLGPDGPLLSVSEYTERVLAEIHLAPPAAGAPREDEEEEERLVSVDANPVAIGTEEQ